MVCLPMIEDPVHHSRTNGKLLVLKDAIGDWGSRFDVSRWRSKRFRTTHTIKCICFLILKRTSIAKVTFYYVLLRLVRLSPVFTHTASAGSACWTWACLYFLFTHYRTHEDCLSLASASWPGCDRRHKEVGYNSVGHQLPTDQLNQ